MRKSTYLVWSAVGLLLAFAAVMAHAQGMPFTRVAWLDDPQNTPFELRNNQIVVPVKIGGGDYAAVLDNGAEMMLIDEAVTVALDIRRARRFRINRGEVSLGAVRVPYQVGPAIITPQYSLVADFSKIDGLSMAGARSIIGRPLFDKSAVHIDFDASKLYVARPAGFQPPAGMTSFGIMKVEGAIVTDFEVGGVRECAILDLGFNGALKVNPEYISKRNLKIVEANGSMQTIGTNPTVEGGVSIKNVAFLGKSYPAVPGLIVSGRKYRGCNFAIGVELMKQYNLAFNLERGAFFAMPRRSAAIPIG